MITTVKIQRTTKPKIEEVLPYYLDGKMLNFAFDFITYLRAEKMNPGWSLHNAWKANSKGKPLCYIRLGKDWVRETKNVKWVIFLYLDHMDEYADKILDENWQDLIWDDLHYCRKPNCPYGCNPGMTATILGKEFSGLCPTIYKRVSFVNPDVATIKIITMLLELERQARATK